jgi:hypothetical protein
VNPFRYRHRPQANAHARKVWDDLHTEGSDYVFARVVLLRRPGGAWEEIGRAKTEAAAWAVALRSGAVAADILVVPAGAGGVIGSQTNERASDETGH